MRDYSIWCAGLNFLTRSKRAKTKITKNTIRWFNCQIKCSEIISLLKDTVKVLWRPSATFCKEIKQKKIVVWWLLRRRPILFSYVSIFNSQIVCFTEQHNITFDLWKCWQLCHSLDESQTKEKRRDERLNCIWDPSLEHQTEFLPAVSGAPGGRSCNFLAERGWTCGHYLVDIKDARP